MDQTTGKSLEEIDVLFAKDEVKESLLAREIMPQGQEKEKDTDSPSCVENV